MISLVMFWIIMSILLLIFVLISQPNSTDDSSTIDYSHIPGWVNPEYSFSVDSILDPLEFGEPFAILCGTARLGMEAHFIRDGSEEYWRLVILFRDRICVLQDQPPCFSEFELDQYPRFLISSLNGSVIASDIPSLGDDHSRIIFFNLAKGSQGEVWLPDNQIDEFEDIINGYHFLNRHGVLTYRALYDGEFISRYTPFGSLDTLRYADSATSLISESSRTGDNTQGRMEISLEDINNLNSINMEIDTSWFINSYYGRTGFYIGETGKYVLISSSQGIICFDASSGNPLFSGLFGFETRSPLISPDEQMWVVEARPIVEYSQTCPSCFIVGSFNEPLTASIVFISSGEYWSDNRIIDISDTGRLLLLSSPSQSSCVLSLIEADGELVWQSDTLHYTNGSHQLTHNFRVRAAAAMSSDGNRLIFSDFSKVYLILIE